MESADTRTKCPGSEPGDSGLSSQSPVGGAAARMATPVGNQAGTIRGTGIKVKIKKYKDKIVLILILILVTLDKYTSVGKMLNTSTTTEIYLNELVIIQKKNIRIFTSVIFKRWRVVKGMIDIIMMTTENRTFKNLTLES